MPSLRRLSLTGMDRSHCVFAEENQLHIPTGWPELQVLGHDLCVLCTPALDAELDSEPFGHVYW